ncbi:hypothetical protein FGG08_001231 [Glutinoglossum americanum]|uniref:VASt domain-containing protein n=1 Tax=Glutinoglossum americanum TaxID=1670608 RepID=A0A9P8IF22_9PEZI|nr:hypothetical protein FGG08_001231 [Glutinoglossum americanum]
MDVTAELVYRTSPLPNLDQAPRLDPRAVPAPKSRESSPSRSSGKTSSIKSTNSPVGKLKEVLKVGPSRRATSPNTSPEREVEKFPSNGSSSGGGLGGLFGRGKGDDRSRRSSISSRRASKAVGFSEEQIPPVPPITIDKPIERPSTAKARLPSQKLITVPTTPPDTALAPVTTVTPPTPVDGPSPSELPPSPTKQTSRAQTIAITANDNTVNRNTVTSPSGNMISHRRARSSSATHAPSKLSSIVSAPLTPTIEEAKTPTLGQGPPGSTGFFSSVFSAAQNAASTLSSSIANTSLAPGQGKSRSGTPTIGEKDAISEEPVVPESVETESEKVSDSPNDKPQKRPAVETIGQGELSLSHLGISMDSSPNEATSPMGSRGSPAGSTVGIPVEGENSSAYQKMLGSNLGAPGISPEGAVNDISRSNTGAGGNGVTPGYQAAINKSEDRIGVGIVEDTVAATQPRATHETSYTSEQSPPRANEWDEHESPPTNRKDSFRPAGRRKRGSSATTIGAAISASHAAVAHPSAMGSVPRLTGFAVASKKRNRDFHQLFRSVPEIDYLIEDYGCALQRDILLQGRLYVSEGHICFHSNIFGWVTTLVISFDEVMSVEKKSTAMVFPNAIVIQTLHAKNVFASFMSRDSTYDLLVGIWKISHPSLQSSVNGVVKLGEAGGGDVKTKQEDSGSDDGTDEDYDEDDEVYDEDEDGGEGIGSFTEAGEGSIAGSVEGDGAAQAVNRKPSAVLMAGGGAVNGAEAAEDGKIDKTTTGIPAPAQDFPGPPTHAPTSVTDPDAFYDKIVRDEVIPAPLGKIYSLLFGPASGDWMTKFLVEDQKVLDLQLDDKKGLSSDKKTRSYSYIKILGAPIGPKQTRCNITEALDVFDLEKAVIVSISTQTPDVPSGNIFTVKTKYCLSWSENNATRLVMSAVIEWTGKSWLKGPIEKGASDGQVNYSQAVFAALRATASGKGRAVIAGSKTHGKTKGKRGRKGTGESTKASGRIHRGGDGADDLRVTNKREDWGLLEPLRGPFGPVVDILKPVMTGNIALGIVVVLVVVMWIRQSRLTSSATLGPTGFSNLRTPERTTAYEEMWRREESELWDWLEDRVGLDSLPLSPAGAVPLNREKEKPRERDIEERFKDENIGEREIEDAIRVTQERLDGLKRVVEKRKRERDRGGGDSSPS